MKTSSEEQFNEGLARAYVKPWCPTRRGNEPIVTIPKRELDELLAYKAALLEVQYSGYISSARVAATLEIHLNKALEGT